MTEFKKLGFTIDDDKLDALKQELKKHVENLAANHDGSAARCESCEAKWSASNYEESGKICNNRSAGGEIPRVFGRITAYFDTPETIKDVGNWVINHHLSRADAIQRIRDIKHGKQTDHIFSVDLSGDSSLLSRPELGAINELMAIFDIQESEL